MARVIIVGAGVSGLTCARRLADAGIDVVVIEARDRVGGRTWTSQVGGCWVDLGGSFLHDRETNPVIPYLRSIGVAVRNDGPWGLGGAVADGEGWVPGHLASTVVTAGDDFDRGEAANALGVEETPWSRGVDWYLADRMIEGRAAELVGQLLMWLSGGLDIGAHPDLISLHGSAAYEDGGGNALPDGGYRRLVDHLAEGLDIRLSSPVTGVRHRDTVVVTTLSGALTADAAVITAPLGVLKAGTISFDPPLPLSHTTALDRLAMAGLEKVILRFDTRWWTEGIARVIHLTPNRMFPAWYDASPSAGAPTLMGFHNPALADPSLSSVAGPERVSLALASLRRLFDRVPEPVAAFATDWTNDPWSQGSYSYLPLGATPEDMRALARPVGPGLILAGEHTVPEAFGTVHAAYISGERAAQAVLSFERSR